MYSGSCVLRGKGLLALAIWGDGGKAGGKGLLLPWPFGGRGVHLCPGRVGGRGLKARLQLCIRTASLHSESSRRKPWSKYLECAEHCNGNCKPQNAISYHML